MGSSNIWKLWVCWKKLSEAWKCPGNLFLKIGCEPCKQCVNYSAKKKNQVCNTHPVHDICIVVVVYLLVFFNTLLIKFSDWLAANMDY